MDSCIDRSSVPWESVNCSVGFYWSMTPFLYFWAARLRTGWRSHEGVFAWSVCVSLYVVAQKAKAKPKNQNRRVIGTYSLFRAGENWIAYNMSSFSIKLLKLHNVFCTIDVGGARRMCRVWKALGITGIFRAGWIETSGDAGEPVPVRWHRRCQVRLMVASLFVIMFFLQY